MKKPTPTQRKILENAAGIKIHRPSGRSQSGGWSGATVACHQNGWLDKHGITDAGRAALDLARQQHVVPDDACPLCGGSGHYGDAARRAINGDIPKAEPEADGDEDACVICGEHLEDGDPVYWSTNDDGHMHADCAASYVDEDGNETDEPPKPFIFRAATEGSADV